MLTKFLRSIKAIILYLALLEIANAELIESVHPDDFNKVLNEIKNDKVTDDKKILKRLTSSYFYPKGKFPKREMLLLLSNFEKVAIEMQLNLPQVLKVLLNRAKQENVTHADLILAHRMFEIVFESLPEKKGEAEIE